MACRFSIRLELPGGRKLVTLRDAAQFIIELPKVERELPQWETAIELLMLVGEQPRWQRDDGAYRDDAGVAAGVGACICTKTETRQSPQGRSVMKRPAISRNETVYSSPPGEGHAAGIVGTHHTEPTHTRAALIDRATYYV